MSLSRDQKIFIAGHRGMVGAAICRKLKAEGYHQLILKSHEELNLLDYIAVREFMKESRPEVVILAAAKVGGIWANKTHPAAFLYENLTIAQNIIHLSSLFSVKRLLFLGSSCIYPRLSRQPIQESELLTGPLESTNEAYAIAKIAGLKLCQYYRQEYGLLYHSVMPTNLYGPGDSYHPEHSHVLPALIYKFHEAKVKSRASVSIWGTGQARREFLHVDDLAEAIVLLLSKNDLPDWVNIGFGKDIPISELAKIIQEVVGYEGDVDYDPSKPEGTPRKLLDSSVIQAMGWRPKINLKEGIQLAYQDFLEKLA